jgi:hypothetical protein
MGLTLVVLAAGIGSRYGGLKQVDPVGPGGATLLDYAAYDARRAGFDRVVLVVREGMEQEVHAIAGERIAAHIPVVYATQTGALPAGFSPPPGRTKPWGTGHATLAAQALLEGPFAVINADDFYGRSSYRILAGFLNAAPLAGSVLELALVAFPLADTLSPDGPVSRGICTVDGSSHLVGIRELLTVERDGADGRARDEDGTWHRIPGATPVSMNFWGFPPGFLPALRDGFARFLLRHGSSVEAEYYLLSAVQDLLRAGRARARVLEGGGPWGGLTHPGDRPRLVTLLDSLVTQGEYPCELWA